MSDVAENSWDLDLEKRATVELDHWLFHKLEGVRFHLHPSTGQPGVAVTMARNEAFLTIASVRKEFRIENDTPDGIMLRQISKALKYVKGLLLGDPLPKEVLTGEASWKVTPTHLQIAHQRVAMRLLTLVSDKEPTVSDPNELLKLADDPEVKRKINEAFAVAAVALGMEADQKQEVIELVNTLAGELGYIESLREKFQSIDQMRDKVQKVRKIYSSRASARENADQVARLMERAKRDYATIFDDIDGRTSEILPMLGNLDDSIAFIRKIRDDIYVRFRAWEEILSSWNESNIEYSVKINELLLKTHQFLAPRFMSFTDWTSIAREEQKRRAKLKVQPMNW